MEISGHCSFCEHKEFDFTNGNLCGLTKQKADFSRKCPKITFGSNAKAKIVEINTEYKQLQDEKLKVIYHLILSLFIGTVIIIGIVYFIEMLFKIGVFYTSVLTEREARILTESLFAIIVGISLIGYAFAPYIKYTNANSAAKAQKKRMDTFFALYDYDYKINFEDENPQTAVKLFRSKRPVK
ncbi:hypothetical protein KORDIASMS9_03441 [Kordia sp. SMS9]|uniref:hypothetical protein n=1 Tax=Kordia sp. SMS9 TaxID=2282170 RepID=UPI000E0D6542|nr:hypothetical protein [Kordia sp. SMS9]AXG71185.1 hypothetical protein KORDIASMS9_03441 [Kordia sp. SMS9]